MLGRQNLDIIIVNCDFTVQKRQNLDTMIVNCDFTVRPRQIDTLYHFDTHYLCPFYYTLCQNDTPKPSQNPSNRGT